MKDLTGLTLYEALKSIKCNVKVGADNGSGFVYCGKPDAVKLNEADAMCIKSAENKLAYARRNLDALITEMEELQKNISKATEYYYEVEHALMSRTHLLKRKVTKVYKSIDESRTLLVMFQGDERGPFWTTNECKSNVKIYEKEDE